MSPDRGAGRRDRDRSRVEAILDLIYEGITDRVQILEELRRKERSRGLEIGINSEKRFKSLIEGTENISFVRPATDDEDRKGIDFVVYFSGSRYHQPVHVQVKSSKKSAREFRKNLRPDDRIIVVNAGPSATDEDIIRDFFEQLEEFDGYT